jgi:hypothetical protein
MTRKQKIEFLKNISSGKASIEDLQPKHCKMIIHGRGRENEYFLDGILSERGYTMNVLYIDFCIIKIIL